MREIDAAWMASDERVELGAGDAKLVEVPWLEPADGVTLFGLAVTADAGPDPAVSEAL